MRGICFAVFSVCLLLLGLFIVLDIQQYRLFMGDKIVTAHALAYCSREVICSGKGIAAAVIGLPALAAAIILSRKR